MWETKKFFKPWNWIMDIEVLNPNVKSEQLGWIFTCPKCNEMSVISTEFGYEKCLEAAMPPPKKFADAWTSQGDAEHLTLNPSIVCATDDCDGHYWIRHGLIQNC